MDTYNVQQLVNGRWENRYPLGASYEDALVLFNWLSTDEYWRNYHDAYRLVKMVEPVVLKVFMAHGFVN